MMRQWFILLLLLMVSLSLHATPAAQTETPQVTVDDSISPPRETTAFEMIMSVAKTALVVTIEEKLAALKQDPDEGITPTAGDPFEKYNRLMFRFNSKLDEKALRPLAEHYREYTPALVRTGVRNFFSNLGDVGVVANDALQGKAEQAFWDTSRLTINTIAGLGGFIDVASMMNINKNHEDFGQTFGVWGIPEGPYVVLPVFGPRTLRGVVGTAMDTYLQAEVLGNLGDAAVGQDIVSEMMALNLINQREQNLGKADLLEQAAIDPYIFTREAYLSYRRCQVEDCDKIDYRPAEPEVGDDELTDELDELDMLDDEPLIPDELDLLDELEQ